MRDTRHRFDTDALTQPLTGGLQSKCYPRKCTLLTICNELSSTAR
jgi:hypothetical protein